MDARAHAEGRRQDILATAILPTDKRAAATFCWPALDPIDGIAIQPHIAQPNALAGDEFGCERGAPEPNGATVG